MPYSLPQLDFSIFLNVNPMIFILCTLVVIFTVIIVCEITIMLFMKIFMFCESSFNKLDMNKGSNKLNVRFKNGS